MLYVSKKETKGEQMATKKPAGLDFKHKQIQREAAIANKPTRLFKVGEEVEYGNHVKTTIEEIFDDGLYYKVYVELKPSRDRKDLFEYQYVVWHSLFPIDSFTGDTSFKDSDYRPLSYYSRDISSLMHQTHFNRTNLDPEYQRGLVWTEEDKTSLLDSIFNHVDIGKFVFIKINYSKKGFDFDNDYYYEVLDGKQRLQTLLDFYEGRWAYRGVYYQNLSRRDRNHFDYYPIQSAEVDEPEDRRTIYDYFLRLNTGGRPIEESHLDKVRDLRNGK